MRFVTRRIHFLALSVLLLSATSAHATPEREFIMSCTYGVLAGTLVGAASLAFVDKPGDNLQHVARGASIGLYMGIGLGFYTAYILPKQIQKEEEERLDHQTDGGAEPQSRSHFFVFPLASEKGVDGAGAIWSLAAF